MEFKGSIVDRLKSQHEIDTQIDKLDEEFQPAECSDEIPELESEGGQYSDGLGDLLPGSGKLGRPHSKMLAGKKKGNDPKRREEKNQSQWKLN